MKKCSKCGEEFPLTSDYFKKRKDSKDGFRGECNSCKAESRKQYFLKNKESIAVKSKEYRKQNRTVINEQIRVWHSKNKVTQAEKRKLYYQENRETLDENNKLWRKENKLARSEHCKKYYESNKATICEKGRARYQNNGPEYAEYKKEYRQGHLELCCMYSQRRRARRRLLPATLTVEQWEQIKKDFDGKCAYCGEELPLEQEHFLPLTKGGEYTVDNIIPACRSCNCSKGVKLPNDWYPSFKHYSKKRENKILEYLNYDKQNNQQLSIL